MKNKDKIPVGILKGLITWIKPELDELFPKPGSCSGLMLLFPPLWFSIIKLKMKKAKAKKKKDSK